MKYVTLTILLSLMLYLPACGIFRKPIIKKHDATVIVNAGNEIKESADKIDDIVDGTEFQEPVKNETDVIREEVKKLSFKEIEALYQPKFDELKNTIKEKDKVIEEKDKKLSQNEKLIEKLKKEIDDLKNFVRKRQVEILNWIAVLTTVLSGVLIYFRLKEFAIVAGLTAVVCFGMAQFIGSVYFLPTVIGCLIIIAIFAGYAIYKQNVSNETEEFVMKTLEAVYNNGTAKEKKWMDDKIFGELSRKMDQKHKNYIKAKKLN